MASDEPVPACPQCGRADINPRPTLGDWRCRHCNHTFDEPARRVFDSGNRSGRSKALVDADPEAYP